LRHTLPVSPGRSDIIQLSLNHSWTHTLSLSWMKKKKKIIRITVPIPASEYSLETTPKQMAWIQDRKVIEPAKLESSDPRNERFSGPGWRWIIPHLLFSRLLEVYYLEFGCNSVPRKPWERNGIRLVSEMLFGMSSWVAKPMRDATDKRAWRVMANEEIRYCQTRSLWYASDRDIYEYLAWNYCWSRQVMRGEQFDGLASSPGIARSGPARFWLP